MKGSPEAAPQRRRAPRSAPALERGADLAKDSHYARSDLLKMGGKPPGWPDDQQQDQHGEDADVLVGAGDVAASRSLGETDQQATEFSPVIEPMPPSTAAVNAFTAASKPIKSIEPCTVSLSARRPRRARRP